MSYYVYVLHSKKLACYYIGQTNNLTNRIKRHNRGYETFTRKGIPWSFIASLKVDTRQEAMLLERKLKGFKSNVRLQKWIAEVVGSATK